MCNLEVLKTKITVFMKNLSFFIVVILTTNLIFTIASNVNANNGSMGIEIPEDVQQIINKSCYDCHNSASSNKKALQGFNFDKLNFLKKQQAIIEWNKVTASVIDGEMPPKKFNKKHPDKRLTMIDKQLLLAWIKTLSEDVKVNLSTQLEDLTNQIIGSLDQNKKSKIAIMEFVDMQANVSSLGKYISEELTTRLYLTGEFEVVERQLLDKIIEEQKISLSGLIDESSAVELGKVLGVDAIASGTITDLGTSVKINARLISAETGQLFSVASVEIPKDDKVKVLLAQNVLSKTTTSSTVKSQTPLNQIVKKEGFVFELQEARLEDKTIICKLSVTNTTENDLDFEVTLGWQYKTMVYTDAGDEQAFTRVKIGSKMNKIYGSSQYDAVVKKVMSGSTEILEIYFENISTGSTKINLLQILSSYSNGFKVEFRNIPLVKD